MALTSDQITAQNFKDFYDAILPYLNGGQSAENVTYGSGTVKDALDETTADRLSASSVSLTKGTTFTAEHDGYIIVNFSGATETLAQIEVENVNGGTLNLYLDRRTAGSGKDIYHNVFVRKGMKILWNSNSTNNAVTMLYLV